MTNFFLGDLIPGKTKPNYKSLEFLAKFLKNYGSFEFFEESDPVTVLNINRRFCLSKGNNRAVLLALNGLQFIQANVIIPEDKEPEIIEIRKRFDELRIRKGIYNVYDLSALVQNPEQYRI